MSLGTKVAESGESGDETVGSGVSNPPRPTVVGACDRDKSSSAGAGVAASSRVQPTIATCGVRFPGMHTRQLVAVVATTRYHQTTTTTASLIPPISDGGDGGGNVVCLYADALPQRAFRPPLALALQSRWVQPFQQPVLVKVRDQ